MKIKRTKTEKTICKFKIEKCLVNDFSSDEISFYSNKLINYIFYLFKLYKINGLYHTEDVNDKVDYPKIYSDSNTCDEWITFECDEDNQENYDIKIIKNENNYITELD